MTKEDALHLQIKSRFTDFLKAAELPYWEPALTVCPHCGEHAGILMDFIPRAIVLEQNCLPMFFSDAGSSSEILIRLRNRNDCIRINIHFSTFLLLFYIMQRH